MKKRKPVPDGALDTSNLRIAACCQFRAGIAVGDGYDALDLSFVVGFSFTFGLPQSGLNLATIKEVLLQRQIMI